LLKIFGKTVGDEIAEERRLFYVALTRASHKTYLLTETGRASVFIEDIKEHVNDAWNYQI
jgi:superfamily I DNA/RNA helicase